MKFVQMKVSLLMGKLRDFVLALDESFFWAEQEQAETQNRMPYGGHNT